MTSAWNDTAAGDDDGGASRGDGGAGDSSRVALATLALPSAGAGAGLPLRLVQVRNGVVFVTRKDLVSLAPRRCHCVGPPAARRGQRGGGAGGGGGTDDGGATFSVAALEAAKWATHDEAYRSPR